MMFRKKAVDPAKAERIAARRATLPRDRRERGPSAAEVSAYLTALCALGCILCRHYGVMGTPAEVHHPRLDVGGGQKCADADAIPLCPEHHRHGKYAVHAMGHDEFAAHHGIHERELQAWVKQLMKGSDAVLPDQE